VFALLHTDLLPSLDVYLNQGGRRVADWCEAQGPAWAIFDDKDPSWDAFANLNSADEAAQRQNGRQARSTKP
jgi:molybdopterin-guanine dinucleotide biosynthesis protein A